VVDQLDSTAVRNLVAIDIAKEWNVVLVQDSSGCRRSFKVASAYTVVSASHNL
jgi:hypothetical protein